MTSLTYIRVISMVVSGIIVYVMTEIHVNNVRDNNIIEIEKLYCDQNLSDIELDDKLKRLGHMDFMDLEIELNNLRQSQID